MIFHSFLSPTDSVFWACGEERNTLITIVNCHYIPKHPNYPYSFDFLFATAQFQTYVHITFTQTKQVHSHTSLKLSVPAFQKQYKPYLSASIVHTEKHHTTICFYSLHTCWMLYRTLNFHCFNLPFYWQCAGWGTSGCWNTNSWARDANLQ